MAPEPLFYTAEPEQEVAGPFDLVQLAALLRAGKVTAETLVFREGEADWIPFGERPQYIVAREIPVDAVSRRIDAAQAGNRSFFPLPSAVDGLRILAVALVLVALYGLIYYLAAAYPYAGLTVAAFAGGAFLFAEFFLLIRLWDEPFYNRVFVGLVPLMDIYYFKPNFWDYLWAYSGKYLGGAVCLGASLGLHDSTAPDATPVCNFVWSLAHFIQW